MKTRAQIKEKLKELQSDERVSYKPASVFSNAPLALIQTEFNAKIAALKWVLKKEK